MRPRTWRLGLASALEALALLAVCAIGGGASAFAASSTAPLTMDVSGIADASTVSGTVIITVKITAGTASEVDLLVDSTPVASATTPPFSLSWDTTKSAAGPHVVIVQARDASGTIAQNRYNVEVDQSPPTAAPATVLPATVAPTAVAAAPTAIPTAAPIPANQNANPLNNPLILAGVAIVVLAICGAVAWLVLRRRGPAEAGSIPTAKARPMDVSDKTEVIEPPGGAAPSRGLLGNMPKGVPKDLPRAPKGVPEVAKNVPGVPKNIAGVAKSVSEAQRESADLKRESAALKRDSDALKNALRSPKDAPSEVRTGAPSEAPKISPLSASPMGGIGIGAPRAMPPKVEETAVRVEPKSEETLVKSEETLAPGASADLNATVIHAAPPPPPVQLKARLRQSQGGAAEFVVVGPEAILGRDPNNPVVVKDALASRRHARIFEQSGAFWIEDLKSLNGTLVNGQPLTQPLKLNADDTIKIGEIVLTYSPDV